MAEEFPDNPQYRMDLSVLLDKIADILNEQNKPDEAQKLYSESLAIRNALAENCPQNLQKKKAKPAGGKFLSKLKKLFGV